MGVAFFPFCGPAPRQAPAAPKRGGCCWQKSLKAAYSRRKAGIPGAVQGPFSVYRKPRQNKSPLAQRGRPAASLVWPGRGRAGCLAPCRPCWVRPRVPPPAQHKAPALLQRGGCMFFMAVNRRLRGTVRGRPQRRHPPLMCAYGCGAAAPLFGRAARSPLALDLGRKDVLADLCLRVFVHPQKAAAVLKFPVLLFHHPQHLAQQHRQLPVLQQLHL